MLRTDVGFYLGNAGIENPNVTLLGYDSSGVLICEATRDILDDLTVFIGIHDPEGRISWVTLDYGDSEQAEMIDNIYLAPGMGPGNTPTATETQEVLPFTRTPTPTLTQTRTPTIKATGTPTPTPTNTSKATGTPTPTPTNTSKVTWTSTPTPTVTQKITTTPTPTRTEPGPACPLSMQSYVGMVEAGTPITVTWKVNEAMYDVMITHLIYDMASHVAPEDYPHYVSPNPNSGKGTFTAYIPTKEEGFVYFRMALRYEPTKGDPVEFCYGSQEFIAQVKAGPPPPIPQDVSLSGITYGRKNGQATVLKNVTVALCAGTDCIQQISDSLGIYAFTVKPGDYTLVGRKTGFHETRTAITLKEGGNRFVDLYLDFIPVPAPTPVGGTYTGHVSDNWTHAPISGARIDLHPHPGYLAEGLTYTAVATSDANGNFSFTHVPPGHYLYFSSHIDYFTWFNSFQATEGGTASGTVELRRRTQRPADATNVDLQPRLLLFTQATQNLNNSLSLAAYHTTEVRVLISTGDLYSWNWPHPISGRLFSTCLPAEGLAPINEARPVGRTDWPSLDAQRVQLEWPNATLNFRLPAACTTPGQRTFTVELRSNNQENNYTNNRSHAYIVNFVGRRTAIVHIWRLSFREFFLCPGDATAAVGSEWIEGAFEKARRFFPTTLELRDEGTADYCANLRPGTVLAGWGYVIFTMGVSNLDYAFRPGHIGYGLANTHECDGTSCNCGITVQPWSSGGLHDRCPVTAAHEMGHGRGLPHAGNYHDEANGGSIERWPYNHGAFSMIGNPYVPFEGWGFEIRQGRTALELIGFVKIPAATNDEVYFVNHELMSYGEPLNERWISDITWNRLSNAYALPAYELNDPAVDIPAGMVNWPDALATRYLLVGGYFDEAGAVQLYGIRPFTDTTGTMNNIFASTSAQAMTYTLQVEDFAGNVLASQNFIIEHPDDKWDSFFIQAPFPAQAAALTILTGTQVITTHLFSSQPPVVEILSPNGGESFTDTLRLTWQASDPDGDPLTYDISYSWDGGQTWQGVRALLNDPYSQLSELAYDIDLAYLPGGENILLKVVASNGLNTAYDLTDAPLTVSRKPPQVSITSLVDGNHFGWADVIPLDGRVTDEEDESPYDEMTFIWTSDVDGFLGYGQYITTFGLTPGWHVITLTATDSDGMSDSASVRIVVGEFIYIPMVRR